MRQIRLEQRELTGAVLLKHFFYLVRIQSEGIQCFLIWSVPILLDIQLERFHKHYSLFFKQPLLCLRVNIRILYAYLSCGIEYAPPRKIWSTAKIAHRPSHFTRCLGNSCVCSDLAIAHDLARRDTAYDLCEVPAE